jgi:uncharacterized protein YndB with AHSA1/START domain
MEEPLFNPVEIHQRFSVPAEDVFDAWTDPALVKKWMFQGEFNNIVQVIIGLEPGGEFSVVKKNDEGYFRDYCGHYHEISRPNLLSFSLEAPETFAGLSNIVLRIMPVDGGSEMVFLQTGVDPAIVEVPWRKMFDQLNRLFENEREQTHPHGAVDSHLL